ncbi:MAG: hypothetical protein QOJ59_2661 [Thermomicrobiales bacterium]|nr:hypothetical protein [Thermomicrobiales bacterium]
MPVTWGGKPAIWMAWTGINPLPDLLALCLASIRRHNGADFEVIVVTPGNLRRYLEPHPAYDYLSLTHRADYLRLYLLHRYGGIYLDMDTIALRPMTEIYADLSECDLVTYDGAPWGEVFGISVFGPTRRGSALTQAWSEAVESLLDDRHDELAANRRSDPNPCGDCLGWSELLRDVVNPIAQRLVGAGRLSARLLEPAWAHFAAGGPAHDDLFRACSPRPPDTELLILNHAMLPDWLKRMSSSEILGSELGICRLLQYALGCSLLSALLTPIARQLAAEGQFSPRLVDPASEILGSEAAICRLLQLALGCGGSLPAKVDPTETGTSRRIQRWSFFSRWHKPKA